MTGKMNLFLLVIASAFFMVSGYGHGLDRFRRDAPASSQDEDECARPPPNPKMEQCCPIPKEHIWGNIRKSVHICKKEMNEREMAGNGENEKTSELPPTGDKERDFHHRIKRVKDGCFGECIFENEGFLVENKVNKQALLDRLTTTLAKEKEWLDVGVEAVEKCTSPELVLNANFTCKSGSEETLTCIFREMFMGCPNWLKSSEYCTTLREFYIRCPNGPPPEGPYKGKRGHTMNGEAEEQ